MNKLLQAGRLDRRVVILRAGPGTVDDYNEPTAGPDIEAETWASVRPAPGTERFVSAENAAQAPMRFVFRWRRDLVRVTDRLRLDGRIYAIASVIEIGRREGLEVLATARGEAVA